MHSTNPRPYLMFLQRAIARTHGIGTVAPEKTLVSTLSGEGLARQYTDENKHGT